jgi:potassium-transporting ATPase ATP-binding subunit
MATPRRLFEPVIVRGAVASAFRKLDPRVQVRNPVMFVVLVGSVLVTLRFLVNLVGGGGPGGVSFTGQVALWLWFTVLFANFAEAMAEGRGKAQADELRKTRGDTIARRLRDDGSIEVVPASALRAGDQVMVDVGEVIPGDGEVVEGIASVDESAITGESAPVIREAGGDRSSVTGGTKVLSDWIRVRVTAEPGRSFLDRMIALVEGAERQKTPNEIALSILLSVLTIIFLVAVVTLQPFAVYSGRQADVVVLIALLVCLIPTTIGALLSAIAIAGMDRMVQHNVLAMSGRAVEAAGDVNTLLLDKTGTITLGNREATELLPLPGVEVAELADAAQLASLSDETPEGRSIVVLAKERHGLRGRELLEQRARFVPFTAQTRMSGADLDGRQVRKGATDAVVAWVKERGGEVPGELDPIVEGIARGGGTPLVVADGARALGVVHLKDIVKGGMRDRFDQLRRMGIRTVMITGDNPLTAAAIASEAGVDDFLAQATPERKMELIRAEQGGGRLIAMTGDGTNDAPALAQADVGVAMNTGTVAAKEAGNMVDLDSNPTKLIEIVEIGKQLLITRGSLTTFSIANDVAKYFAIIPALFAATYPVLDKVNILRLETPQSAVLSAVIFNALIIVALIPLALRERIAQGRVYAPEKIRAALTNCFRMDNLIALRSLALREVAEQEERQLLGPELAEHQAPPVLGERVMVCIDGRPDSSELVRRAARMARRATGRLYVLHVEPDDEREPAGVHEAVEAAERLGLQLGATVLRRAGDVADTVARVARELAITQIVLGESHRPRWKELVGQSIIARVLRETDGVDVHVIADKQTEATKEVGPRGPQVHRDRW